MADTASGAWRTGGKYGLSAKRRRWARRIRGKERVMHIIPAGISGGHTASGAIDSDVSGRTPYP